MHENNGIPARQDHIRPPWQPTPVQAKANATPVQERADCHFRPRILASYPGHHARTGFWRDLFHHLV